MKPAMGGRRVLTGLVPRRVRKGEGGWGVYLR